jgi:hypothetical protein
LHEAQISRRDAFSEIRRSTQGLRSQDSAGDDPERAGAGPGHAFEKSPAVNAVMIVIVDEVRHGVVLSVMRRVVFRSEAPSFIHTELRELYSRKVMEKRASGWTERCFSGRRRNKTVAKPVLLEKCSRTRTRVNSPTSQGSRRWRPSVSAEIARLYPSPSYRCLLHIVAMLRRPRTVRFHRDGILRDLRGVETRRSTSRAPGALLAPN